MLKAADVETPATLEKTTCMLSCTAFVYEGISLSVVKARVKAVVIWLGGGDGGGRGDEGGGGKRCSPGGQGVGEGGTVGAGGEAVSAVRAATITATIGRARRTVVIEVAHHRQWSRRTRAPAPRRASRRPPLLLFHAPVRDGSRAKRAVRNGPPILAVVSQNKPKLRPS
jgi:hypothetical protein